MKILQYIRVYVKNSTIKIAHYKTFHFLRYAHFRFAKCLFTNIQRQLNSLKSSLLFKKNAKFRVNNSRILRIQNGKFSGYHFYMNTTKYRDFQICISVPLIFFMDDKQLLVNLDCYLMLCFVYIKHLYNCFLILLHLFHMDMFLPNRLIVFFSHR